MITVVMLDKFVFRCFRFNWWVSSRTTGLHVLTYDTLFQLSHSRCIQL